MKEGTGFRIKQYRVWIYLLAKRLWRQPVYVGLLVLIPVLGCVVGIMERGERGGAAVAVCVEDGTWSEALTALLLEQEGDSVLRFDFCTDWSEVERRVAGGEADCGFLIASEIEEKVLDGEWRKIIKACETDSSSITGMAKERIAGVIFRLYSETCYEKYMGQISAEAALFAVEAYENHLADGSTFGFHYIYDDYKGQYSTDTAVGNDNIVNTVVFPMKGLFAVLIFIGGMCGMLEYEKDKKEKKFMRMSSGALTYMVDIWISTVFLAAAVLICLWIADGIRFGGGKLTPGKLISVWDAGMWGRQIMYLFFYQCIIIIY